MGQTARTDREIDADFATVTISLPSIESLLIGRSRKMAEVRRLIARVARSQASVLVTGPTGSGKEVVARCLHETSSKRGASFVAVNCGALPRDRLESEPCCIATTELHGGPRHLQASVQESENR